MSSAVLKRMDPDDEGLLVSGYPWLDPGEEKPLTRASLVSRVLCKRHNEALAPLDKMAGRFCDRIETMWAHTHQGRDLPHNQSLFNGLDLERWLYKVLLGTWASLRGGPEKSEPVSGPLSRDSIAWLSGSGRRPEELTLLVNATDNSPGPDGLSFRPLKGRGKLNVVGLEMHFLGVWLELWFRSARAARANTHMPQPYVRPNELRIRRGSRTACLLIEWP